MREEKGCWRRSKHQTTLSKSVAGPRPFPARSRFIINLVTFPIKFHSHSRHGGGLKCGDNGCRIHQTPDTSGLQTQDRYIMADSRYQTVDLGQDDKRSLRGIAYCRVIAHSVVPDRDRICEEGPKARSAKQKKNVTSECKA